MNLWSALRSERTGILIFGVNHRTFSASAFIKFFFRFKALLVVFIYLFFSLFVFLSLLVFIPLLFTFHFSCLFSCPLPRLLLPSLLFLFPTNPRNLSSPKPPLHFASKVSPLLRRTKGSPIEKS